MVRLAAGGISTALPSYASERTCLYEKRNFDSSTIRRGNRLRLHDGYALAQEGAYPRRRTEGRRARPVLGNPGVGPEDFQEAQNGKAEKEDIVGAQRGQPTISVGARLRKPSNISQPPSRSEKPMM